MAWTDRSLQPGDTVAGYRIESVIGRGGMGVVYKAVHERLDRPAALKVLSPMFHLDPGYEARFHRESQLAARLDNPNVLEVYDAGDENGILYIAMRYVDGGDLRDLLGREGTLSPERTLWLSPERTLSIVKQTAGALDAAHAAGLVHRDVKPANILVGSGGRVYLADFGIAKPAGESSLTVSGSILGTLEYCSPEQIDPKRIDNEPLDGRADVYALGCVAFHCLTGKPPFDEPTQAAMIMAQLNELVPAVGTLRPDLPRALDGVIAVATAKHRDARFATAGELARSLESALAGTKVADETVAAAVASATTAAPPPPEPETARPDPEPTRVDPTTPAPPGETAQLPSRPGNRRPWLIAAVAALVLALAGGAMAALVLSGGGEKEVNPPTTVPTTTTLPVSTFDSDVAATIKPLVQFQQTVNRRLASLSNGSSIVPVQTAAETLDHAVLQAQADARELHPATGSERRVAGLLQKALRRQADYAAAVEGLASPSDLTKRDAQRVANRAGSADAAYLTLSGALDRAPSMPATRRSAEHLVAIVPVVHRQPVTRTISLAPLLVGFLPDDPPGRGRCFGPYKSTAALTIDGARRHDHFVACGDYGYPSGDPNRATGEYRFRPTGLPPGFGFRRFTATVGVDEDSSSRQAGATVTWTLYYRGNEVCSRSTVWSGGRSAPIRMICTLPGDGPTDTDQIVISQRASVVSSSQFWAGVQDPTLTAVRP